MNLIDRYLEFHEWPTSKKTVLLMAIALIFHIIVAPITLFFAYRSGILKEGIYEIVVLSSLAVIITCLLAGWISNKIGKEGRWTAYLVVFLYGGWMNYTIDIFGMWSTPFIAWVPAVVILVTVWYDVTVGLSAVIFTFCTYGLAMILMWYEVIPYGPILANTDFLAQANLNWSAAMMIPIAGVFIYAFSMVVLTVLARQYQDQRLHAAHNIIRRYVPEQVADKILSQKQSEGFTPQRKKLTIFFSDVEGFTNASDHLDPEDLSSILDHYLSEMAGIAAKYEATINQFVGDGIMLFFGAPEATNDKDHAVRAVRMALEMQARMGELHDTWTAHGIRTPFRVRMGINTGYASVGDFGSSERKEYTAIGIQTNLASRIQAKCHPGKVLVSDTTYALVKEEFDCEFQEEYELKGIHFPVRTYEVIGEKGKHNLAGRSGRVVHLQGQSKDT